jgi:hypothetical protein
MVCNTRLYITPHVAQATEMSNQAKLQNSVQNTRGSQSVETGSSHAQDFETTFQLAFGREMTPEEQRYFRVEKSQA